MTSRTVKSPADETVEIVSDDDWCLTAGVGINSLKQWNHGMKRLVLRELWERGSVTNKSGQAAKELFEQIREHFDDVPDVAHTSLSGLMRAPVNAACFEVETNGKRTFEIALVAMPERYYNYLMLDIRKSASNGDRHAAETVANLVMPDQLGSELVDQLVDESDAFEHPQSSYVAERTELDPIPVDRTTDDFDDSLIGPALDVDMASQVAMSLLTTVVEIISAGSPEAMDNRVQALHGDLLEVQSRLGQRLEENQALRKRMSLLADEVTALKYERDGLRVKVRKLEANLNSALKGDALQVVNGVIQKKVDEFMRAAPTTKKGDD